MEESLQQRVDAGGSIKKQRVQESPLHTVDAVVSLTYIWYKSLYIRQLVHASPYQTVDAGAVSIFDGGGWSLYMRQPIQESVYQTVGGGFSIPGSGCRSLYIR